VAITAIVNITSQGFTLFSIGFLVNG